MRKQLPMNKPLRIKSNLEYLRKLFIMPDSPDKFIEFGNELLEMIHDFFQEKGAIHSSITLPELSRIFNQKSLPHEPRLIKDVLAEIKTKIIAHSVESGKSLLYRSHDQRGPLFHDPDGNDHCGAQPESGQD